MCLKLTSKTLDVLFGENVKTPSKAATAPAQALPLIRLVTIFILDAVAVWVALTKTGFVWNSLDRDRLMRMQFRNNLVIGSLAALAIVFVVPVLRQGKVWQKILALVLLGFSALVLITAFFEMRSIG